MQRQKAASEASRPTTKDLAREAGVSRATVDRVLNERPGVHKKTVDAVNAAIERLGFVRNQSAANLARSRTYRFDFLLPRIGDEFLATVVERIEEAAAVFGLEGMRIRHRRILESDPHQVAALLSRISAEELDGLAIMAPESPQVRDAITRLKERGVQVVQFVAGQHDAGPSDFVGFNNRAAGATAGRLIGRFCRGEAGKVLVVSERMSSLDSVERRLGFDAILTADYPELSTLPSLETYGDTERTRNVVHTSFQSHADIVAVYILSSEPRAALTAIAEATDSAKQVILAHERTRFTEQMLLEGRLDAVIAQNPGHLVRSAIRILRARADGREPLASQETIRIEIILKENLIQ